MVDDPLSLALREMRAHLGHPVVLATLAVMSLILGLSGPFATYDLLRAGPRVAYWTIVVFGTYSVGTLVSEALGLVMGARGTRVWRQVIVTGLANGVFSTAFLMVLNGLAFAARPNPLDAVIGLFTFVTTVSLGVSAVHALADHHRKPARATPPASIDRTPREPALLARLPLDRRGSLVSIRVEDHYVEVTTTAGSAMVLMRLSDAIAETAPEPGLQVHRSHWVALSRIAAAERRGDTAVLTLDDGRAVPVSRGKLPAVQAAGLLPATLEMGRVDARG